MALSDQGFTNVVTALGGAAGLDALARSEVSDEATAVAVVDIRMPPPDGYELLARINSMDPSRRPLSLAVTGDPSSETKLAALEAGASDFITKPVDAVELGLRVSHLANIKFQEQELRRTIGLAGELRMRADDAAEHASVAAQYFRLLADNSADVVIHLRGTEVAWISPSVQDTFGWPSEQWIGTDVTSWLHPDDLGNVFARLAEIGQGRWSTERVRVATADGDYRWTEGHGKPYVDADGNVDGVIGALRVIDEQVKAEQLSAEAQVRYQTLFESAPDAMVVVAADGSINSVNSRAEEMFGYSREDLLGMTVEMLLPHRFRANHSRYIDGFFTRPKVRPMGVGGDLFALRGNGTQFPVEVSLSPIRIGSESSVLAAVRDVTQLRAAQSEAQLAAVVRFSADAIVSFTLDGIIDSANPSAGRLLGCPAEDIVGRSMQSLLPPQSRRTFATVLQRLRRGEHTEPYETSWLHSDGSQVDVGINVFGIHDTDGELFGFSAIVRDITAEVEARQQLERLARFDTLTGLFNRGEAIANLDKALEDRRSPEPGLGVLFCDVDNFKAINDDLGHVVGDAVLSAVATRVRECVRSGDIVGRIGGDEILVLLHGVHTMAEAAEIAEKIRCRVADPIRHGDRTLRVTVSIGATLAVPNDSASATTTRADAAMYESKHAGGNTVRCVER